MYRLSLIISEIYNKYLPLAEKDGIILNLDFSDTTKEITDPERVKKYLDESLDSTLKRTSKGDKDSKGEVTIGVDKSCITVTDSATTLSPAACALLSNRYIDVRSRVGFGTTVKIFFTPREIEQIETTPKPAIEVEGVGFSAKLDDTAKAGPSLNTAIDVAAKQGRKRFNLGAKLRLLGKKPAATESKTASKSKTVKPAKPKKSLPKPQPRKTTKTKTSKTAAQRKIDLAARKADREVKRIAKKVNKQTKKASKPVKKAAKAATKQIKRETKTVKKKLKLS